MPSSRHFNIFHFAVVGLLCAISGVTVSYGQADSIQVSGKIFELQDFERIVLSNHPIVKQAGLLSEQARAQLQQAWGVLIPISKVISEEKLLETQNIITTGQMSSKCRYG